MADHLGIEDFLDPVNRAMLSQDRGYKEGQIGYSIHLHEQSLPDLDETQLVIVGCPDHRGAGIEQHQTMGPDAIRRQFYNLFYWHSDLVLADVGNIRTGATLPDTYAALRTVVSALIGEGKTVIILGGSHDLTTAQYQAYVHSRQLIEATLVDALIDLDPEAILPADHFLMDMLTATPNFIRHYNHIGFQSYCVNPQLLETLDKLRFDCFRVGNVKEAPDEMEPVIRNSHLFSFDLSSLANAYSPASTISPNGFTGEEACTLFRYAGMSPTVNTVGVYGYDPRADRQDLSAKQVAQMLWYLLDGRSRGRREASLQEKDSFNEYYMAFAEVETIFLQSKKTGRWWMQLPNKQFIACSYKDYLLASSNEIPERWLRAQERG
ncbi:MAG: formimidoylglutamase [Sphingomonadales bacterium]|nr:formimidoylglutamase [Sphingomonadales bacterium]